MTGEVFGADGLIILVIALVTLVVPIWALVDAIPDLAVHSLRPDRQRGCGSP